MAAVALACESQSTSRVGCLAAPRQAARLTAVVVFPTPPFWFATAMIRAKPISCGEKLTKCVCRCKMFHVKHQVCCGISMWPGVFHVEHALLGPWAALVVPRGTLLYQFPCPARAALLKCRPFAPAIVSRGTDYLDVSGKYGLPRVLQV